LRQQNKPGSLLFYGCMLCAFCLGVDAELLILSLSVIIIYIDFVRLNGNGAV
jgi:hypothetical protein